MFIQKFNTKYKGLNKINGGWTYANCIEKFFFNPNLFSIRYSDINLWQCIIVLNWSEVDLIKRSKYITNRIFWFFFEWESFTFHKQILKKQNGRRGLIRCLPLDFLLNKFFDPSTPSMKKGRNEKQKRWTKKINEEVFSGH